MASTANVTIQGTVTSLPSGNSKQLGPVTITNANSLGSITDTTLGSGANTITIPSTTAIGVLITPPTGNTVALTLKGVAGDTGVAMHLTNPTFFSFPAGTADFVITAASATSAPTEFFWV